MEQKKITLVIDENNLPKQLLNGDGQPINGAHTVNFTFKAEAVTEVTITFHGMAVDIRRALPNGVSAPIPLVGY